MCFWCVTGEFLCGSNRASWLHAQNWVTAELNTSASAFSVASLLHQRGGQVGNKSWTQSLNKQLGPGRAGTPWLVLWTQEVAFQKCASNKHAFCRGKVMPSVSERKPIVTASLIVCRRNQHGTASESRPLLCVPLTRSLTRGEMKCMKRQNGRWVKNEVGRREEKSQDGTVLW